MKTLSSDTDPQVEKVQITRIREASISKRLGAVHSLVRTTRWLSWKAISERYSDQTERFRVERYVSLLYGDESLAKRISHRLFGKA